MLSTTCQEFGYTADDRWAKVPPGWEWREVAGVATDSRDRVFVFNRGNHPLMVFAPDGTFLDSWGEGVFTRAHGITIGPDDTVYCTDDMGHAVHVFGPDGKLVRTLGDGEPSDTGATSMDYRSIRRAGPPFHYPCNLAVAPDATLYVCDGYGNARVHAFSPDGRLRFSWGEPGSGPGQFNIPHGIAVDRAGTVYVADRENSRIQLFTPKGDYVGEWADVARPCEVSIDRGGNFLVAELGHVAGMWPGTTAPADATGGRVSVFDPAGRLLARWGGGTAPCAPGDFFAPHDICSDSLGDIYVSEVVWSAGGSKGLVPAGCHALQKFARRG